MVINHIGIWTNDLERLKEFYSRFFDCKVSERYDNIKKQFSSYFLSFSDGAKIEIMKRSDISGTNDVEKIGLAHFAFEVGPREMVENMARNFEQAGVIIESYPRTTGDGFYECVILDPDMNKIELIASRK